MVVSKMALADQIRADEDWKGEHLIRICPDTKISREPTSSADAPPMYRREQPICAADGCSTQVGRRNTTGFCKAHAPLARRGARR
ncbi:hypothetical protein DVVG_00033 [Dunaliella viridis virus SI2]|uniref:hypothetical protein n=1 Tax=Dunaliella viridis virus SI2 TaxID=754069 RepID=UPI0002C0B7CD|nr:hypothetical protein DVVG_00033 [Dunaliella viridis virus SI2]AGH16019.1 hypothetical protein DVVG_00033 [Dunaliella viridis virus SI2]